MGPSTYNRAHPLVTLWPPLLALLAARAASAGVAWATGYDPLRAQIWVRWDAGIYLGIASRGYFLEHCGPGTGLPPTAWCGYTAWFPLYPWLIAILGNTPAAGALIALASHFAALWVLWRFFLRGRENSFLALALAAFFPGSIYAHACSRSRCSGCSR